MTAALTHRGINYDTGINYVSGELSRVEWDAGVGQRDMRAIADDLHCSAVCIFGSDLGRLESCARSATESGLDVWIQPRLIDHREGEVLEHLAEAGRIAAQIAADGASSVLHLGCELSIFLPGILRGETYVERMERLNTSWWSPLGSRRRLNDYLSRAQQHARATFSGPLTYAAGEWERVDWSGFDVIGVNLYREDANRASYADTVSGLVASGKPVVITEFGSCSYTGADRVGGGGHDIIDYTTTPPTVNAHPPRNEGEQADHLEEIIDLLARQGASGAFVYAFSEPKPVLGRPVPRPRQGQLRHRPDDAERPHRRDLAAEGSLRAAAADLRADDVTQLRQRTSGAALDARPRSGRGGFFRTRDRRTRQDLPPLPGRRVCAGQRIATR